MELEKCIPSIPSSPSRHDPIKVSFHDPHKMPCQHDGEFKKLNQDEIKKVDKGVNFKIPPQVNNPSMEYPPCASFAVSPIGEINLKKCFNTQMAKVRGAGNTSPSSDTFVIEMPWVLKFPEKNGNKQRKSLKIAYAVIAIATQVTATAVAVIASSSSVTVAVKVLWYSALIGSQAALISSLGAIYLQDKKPKVSCIMEKIGTVAGVLSFIGMAATSLSNNLMWLSSIPCTALLVILTVKS